MSEKEQKQEAGHTEKGAVVSSGAPQNRREKQKWTVERCKKAARRFLDEQAWKAGAPSSYKAAVSHGWRDQCVAHMTGNVVAIGKKSATRKSPKKLPQSA